MAYERANPIKKISGGVGGVPAVWGYEDGDTMATIDGSGYFNLEAARLNVNDLIYVSGASGTYGHLVILTNTRDELALPPVAGVVDTNNITALSAIDSD